MYLINGTLSNSLPFRLHLPDGRTRTSLHEMSEAQLAEMGIYPVDEVKPALTWTQHHGTPEIMVTDGRATATYPIIDYSPVEISEMLAAVKEQKKAEIAAARYETEIAGVTFNGFFIHTDRESRSLMTGTALKASMDPNYVCRWKTGGGFISLSSPQIIAVADIVREYVQGCFDREGDLCGLIDAATDVQTVNAITWQ